MKLAVLGQGPLAVHSALHFHHLGAEVTIYKKDSFGGNLYLLLKKYPDFKFMETWEELTTELGRELSRCDIPNLKSSPTVKEYWNEYFQPLVEKSELFQISKTAEVKRVHKRFLSKKENIPGRTRLHDLFRVIYTLDPKDSILKQVEEFPEAFDQLGSEVVNSLSESVEGFHDYDLVIDARGKYAHAHPMGASNAPALNEQRLSHPETIFYGKDFLVKAPDFSQAKHIALIGSGETIALSLLQLKDWFIKNVNVRLYLFCDEIRPFETITNQWMQKRLQTFFEETSRGFEDAKANFERAIREWRDLEDFEKTKIQKPVEPVSRLMIYAGFSVTAIDKLLDREGVFITAERAKFRGEVPSDDEEEMIKTIPADYIIVGKGYNLSSRDSLNSGLVDDEPGYYDLRGLNLKNGLGKIPAIEKNILSFFSRQN